MYLMTSNSISNTNFIKSPFYCFNYEIDNQNNHNSIPSCCHSNRTNGVDVINHVILIVCIKFNLTTKFDDHSYYNSEEKRLLEVRVKEGDGISRLLNEEVR